MCLAVPMRIESIDGTNGLCSADGVTRTLRLDLVPAAQAGDFVLAHAGFAIEILGEQQARENLAALREVLHAR